MLSDKKKVAIVGVGMVGMSFAYAAAEPEYLR